MCWRSPRRSASYRKGHGIDGPLFLGIDTHALSQPACASALEVLAANGVEVMLATHDEYTPTPAISHAILAHNRGRTSGLADGIVVTPSHNPPDNGGFKYNPPNGGPAGEDVTGWIEAAANGLLERALDGRQAHPARAGAARARRRTATTISTPTSPTSATSSTWTRSAPRRSASASIRSAAPACTTGRAIAERYRLDLTVVSDEVDPTFRFMTVDWDGQIRMDPSSPYAMQRLLALKDRFDIAFACDTDHDRHGIVTRRRPGCCAPNHYLSVAIDYLFQHRPQWRANAAVGKTVVSTRLIDLVAARLGRTLYEVPVGFKWFVAGLLDGSLGFGGEESAGAAFLRRDGTVWTTDKDGIVAGAARGRDHRAPRARSGRAVRRAGARVRRPGRRPRRGAGDGAAKEAARGARAAAHRGDRARRRDDHRACSATRRATARRSAASR